jgi:MYXO-CTERM domain-containing protein
MEDERHDYTVGVGDEFAPWCSGTLISPQTVLTAGHCALGITAVWFGKIPVAWAPVDTEIIHPAYNGDQETPDLAILRVAVPLHVQAAPLLRRTLTNDPEFIGPPWTFVGYGIDDAQAMTGFGVRRFTTIPLTAIGPTMTLDNQVVSEAMVYYETMGSSPCYGDSGGSSFFIADGVEHQAAVTAWGSQLCDAFGVHARVDQPTLDSFVQPHINAFESGSSCQNDGSCDEACNTDGQVFDPDCQWLHCGADALCARACVAPLDPDCSGMPVDHCPADGVCMPGCSPPDSDCGGEPAVSVTTPTSSLTSTATPPFPSSPFSSTSTSTSASGGGAGPAPRNDADTRLYARSCGCGVPSVAAPRGLALALVGAALALARRRRRSR